MINHRSKTAAICFMISQKTNNANFYVKFIVAKIISSNFMDSDSLKTDELMWKNCF